MVRTYLTVALAIALGIGGLWLESNSVSKGVKVQKTTLSIQANADQVSVTPVGDVE